MKIFAIADLHLCFGTPEKSMEIFGDEWKDYPQKIKKNWEKKISDDDLILIPGDISWAKSFDEAIQDLSWIDTLSGKKIIIKGNHDYWWSTKSKLKEYNFSSLHFIQNDAINVDGVTITGTRLWDCKEYDFEDLIIYKESPIKKIKEKEKLDDEKIFSRECERLKLGLNQMDKNAKVKIVMTHYPPISNDLKESTISKIFDQYEIDICVFGHLHHVIKKELFGQRNKTKYFLVSSDYLNFDPLRIY